MSRNTTDITHATSKPRAFFKSVILNQFLYYFFSQDVGIMNTVVSDTRPNMERLSELEDFILKFGVGFVCGAVIVLLRFV